MINVSEIGKLRVSNHVNPPMFLSCFSRFLHERYELGSGLGLGIGLVLGDRVRVRFEVRVRLMLFICTNVIENLNKKMAVLWYISVALQFFNKVLKFCH